MKLTSLTCVNKTAQNLARSRPNILVGYLVPNKQTLCINTYRFFALPDILITSTTNRLVFLFSRPFYLALTRTTSSVKAQQLPAISLPIRTAWDRKGAARARLRETVEVNGRSPARIPMFSS